MSCYKYVCSTYINTNINLLFTIQPANATVGYVRHLDAFASSSSPTAAQGGSEQQQQGHEKQEKEIKSTRKLTCIMYLNKFFEGGQLRIHLGGGTGGLSTEGRFCDIDPCFGRLVIFRR